MSQLCPHCHSPIEVSGPRASEPSCCPQCGSSLALSAPELPTMIGNVSVGSLKTLANVAESSNPSQHSSGFDEGHGRLGKFDLLGILGRGAFGTVYKARDTELDRVVAVKIPRTAAFAGAEEQDRFLREARSVARLRHPAIVSIHEVGQMNGVPFLVSDFVEGVTLAQWIVDHRPSSRQAAELTAAVADAVQYAHDQGVVHRDIKPANIMIGPDGGVHVMDFGLARRESGDATMTTDGQILGTPAYMSPEQARGESHQVDGRGDVYSLGVVLYELLAGERPFRGNVRMLLHQVLHEEPRSPRSLNDQVPLDLETICRKAMAKEPARRYQTAADFAADLRAHLEHRPIQARPIGRIERWARWCRRKPAIASLTAGMALLLLVSAIGGYWLAYKERSARKAADASEGKANAKAAEALSARDAARDAQRIAEANEQESRRRRASLMTANGLRAVRDGELYGALPWFAEALRLHHDEPDLAFHDRYRIAAVLRQSPKILHQWTADTHNISWARFSPDGKLVGASSNAPGGFRLWDVATGKLLAHSEEIQTSSFQSRGWKFTPDGRYLVAHTERICRVWTLPDLKPVGEPVSYPVISEGGKFILSVAVSPDSRKFAVGLTDYRPGDTKLTAEIRSIDTGALLDTAVPDRGSDNSHVEFSPDGRRLAIYGWHWIDVWDLERKEWAYPSLRPDFVQYRAGIQAVAYSPDGRKLATCWGSIGPTPLIVWDASTGKQLYAVQADREKFSRALFSPDGTRLLSVADDLTVRLWDAESGVPLFTPMLHSDLVVSVAFSPDGQFIATGQRDGLVKVWNVSTGKVATSILPLGAEVRVVEFHPNGRYLLCAGASNQSPIRIWDLGGETAPQSPADFLPSDTHHLGLSPDGRRSLTMRLSDPAVVRVWDRITDEFIGPPLVHPVAVVGGGSFTPDGARVLTVGLDHRTRVWDVGSGKMLAEIAAAPAAVAPIMAASFQDCGRSVMTTTGFKGYGSPVVTRLWDAENGKQLCSEFQFAWADSRSLELSPDGRLAIAEKIELNPKDPSKRFNWVPESSLIRTADGTVVTKVDFPHEARFNSRGDRLAYYPQEQSGGHRRPQLHLVNCDSGQDTVLYEERHTDLPFCFAFSADGTRLALAMSSRIRVWDSATAELIRVIDCSLQLYPKVIRFSPDGNWLAGASSARMVAVWDVAAGRLVSPAVELPTHADELAFSRDGRRIFCVMADQRSLVLDSSTGELLTPISQLPRSLYRQIIDPPLALQAVGSVELSVLPDFWDIAPDNRPVEELLSLARLLSSRDVDTFGGLLPVPGEEIASLWSDMVERYPHEFSPVSPRRPEDNSRALADLRRFVARAIDLGRWKEADEGLSGLIRDAAPDPLLLARRAYVRTHLRRMEEAAQDFETALAMTEPAPALLYRAAARYESGDFPGVIADVSRYLELVERAEPDAWFYRGNAHCELGQFRPAVADLSNYFKSAAERPDDGSAYFLRAVNFVELRRDSVAASAEREIARRGGAALTLALAEFKAGNAAVFRELGAMLERMGDFLSNPIRIWAGVIVPNAPDQVQKTLKRADEYVTFSPPNTPLPHFLLGAALFRDGKFAAALEQLDKAVPAPGTADDPRRFPFLAMTHYRLNHADDARAWLEKCERWLAEAVAPGKREQIHSPTSLQTRLALEILTAEAKALIFGRNPAPTQRPAPPANSTPAQLVEFYTDAIAKDPADVEPYRQRAAALARVPDYAAALADYLTALRLKPEDPDLLSQAAQLHLRLGQRAESVEVARKLQMLKPGKYTGLQIASMCASLAYSYAVGPDAHGERRLAVDLGERAVELVPETRSVHEQLGYIYCQVERWDDAVRELELAERLPVSVAQPYLAWSYLVRAEHGRGNRKQALEYVERMKRWGSENEARLSQAARTTFENFLRGAETQLKAPVWKAPAGATPQQLVTFFSKIVADDPSDAEALLQRASALWNSGQNDAVLADLQAVLKLQPGHPRALNAIASFELSRRHVEESLRAARQLLDLMPGEFTEVEIGSACSSLVWSYAAGPDDMGQRKLAVELAQRAVALLPKSFWGARQTLGMAYFRAKSWDDAVREMEGVLKEAIAAKQPFSAWLYLAMAEHRRGNREKAREYLEETRKWGAEHAASLTPGSRNALQSLQKEAEGVLNEPAKSDNSK